jgi:glyoxylase-like metal-dependent hydrolase (beta-lactamase superfamily II)
MAMTWFKVGALEIARIVEVEEPFLEPEKMFAEATPDAIASAREWMGPHAFCPDTGKLILPIQSYLIRTPHHLALVDTCLGNHKSPAGFKRWAGRNDPTYLRRLGEAGVHPDEIDFVFCTHLHLDHSGWHTEWRDGKWMPTFPNARYIFAKEEYSYAEREYQQRQDPVFVENVLPVMEAGRGVLVDVDYALDDTLYLESTPGHTPGHCAIRLASAGQTGVVTGDLIHSPLQCAHPDWNFRFDDQPELARITRRSFLERHCDAGTLILATHFPSPSVGWFEHRGDAYRYRYRD